MIYEQNEDINKNLIIKKPQKSEGEMCNNFIENLLEWLDSRFEHT